MPWTTSGAGPRAGPEAPAVGHFIGQACHHGGWVASTNRAGSREEIFPALAGPNSPEGGLGLQYGCLVVIRDRSDRGNGDLGGAATLDDEGVET